MKEGSWLKVRHNMKYKPDQIQVLTKVSNESDSLNPTSGQHGDWTLTDVPDSNATVLTYLGKSHIYSSKF